MTAHADGRIPDVLLVLLLICPLWFLLVFGNLLRYMHLVKTYNKGNSELHSTAH